MREIGSGTFGKVKLVLNTEENNKQYAMKAVKKKLGKFKSFLMNKAKTPRGDSTGNPEIDNVMREIAIMKKLVSALDFFSHLYYCMKG